MLWSDIARSHRHRFGQHHALDGIAEQGFLASASAQTRSAYVSPPRSGGYARAAIVEKTEQRERRY